MIKTKEEEREQPGDEIVTMQSSYFVFCARVDLSTLALPDHQNHISSKKVGRVINANVSLSECYSLVSKARTFLLEP